MIKRILGIMLVILLISPQIFASENIISSLVINDEEERDIDIVMDKNKMYLPTKYILNYFKIPFKESHVEKSLTFQNCAIKNSAFYIDGIKQSCPVFFVKSGLINCQNEFFLSSEILNKALNKNISSDDSQLLAFIKKREKIETPIGNENPFLTATAEKKPQAYDEITLPAQKGWLSLDKILVRENMFSDSYSQIYRDSQSKTATFNNNMQLTLAGKLKSGEYSVDMGTNSYTSNLLSFSGISPKYKNQYKGYDYVIGKTEAWDFGENSLSTDIMGFQVKNNLAKEEDYKKLEGKVNKTSTIKVYLNDDFEKELSTYGGLYTLKGLYYGKEVKKIRIEELLADGSKKEVFKKEYNYKFDKKRIPAKDFILGVSGLQNRLWANNGYIYETNTQKAVMGFKHNKKISDKLTMESFLTADKIFKSPENTAWSQSVLGNRKYLNYTTMQNPNALDGQTFMGTLSYKSNERMTSRLIYGASNSTSKDSITKAGLGYLLQYEHEYSPDEKTSLKGSLFATSPNFYVAGYSSGSGFASDRMGGRISGNTSYKNLMFLGSYSKYKSNFGEYYDGGLMDFDEYNFVARANFKKLPSMTLKINNKKGANTVGEISSSAYEFSANKSIKCFDIDGGIRKNIYSNQYNSQDYSSYSSEYSDIFTNIKFPLGRRCGRMEVGHEIVTAVSDTTTNNYNSLNLAYSSPSFKGMNLNVSTGLHYSGTNKGNDFGFGVSKKLKSGSTVSLNYRYSQIPYYMIDNMYIPGSMRHSITVDFSELYGISGKGLQAVGTGNENKGYLQVSAFLDVNQNGIKDKGEPMIENIPIKVENDSEIILTSKEGNAKLKAEDAGVHNVKVFEDEMPTLLCCHEKTKPSRYIKIENNSKSKVEFGLISSVGNINGSITIKDEFNNNLRFDDLVVSVLDVNGKEVNYANLNEDGTFSFSGLSPGKYVVTIDKEFQDLYKIFPDRESESFTVRIPPVYKDYVNIDNVNLNYKYQI